MRQNLNKSFLKKVMALGTHLTETKNPRHRYKNIYWEDCKMTRTPPENRIYDIWCCRKLTFISISHNNHFQVYHITMITKIRVWDTQSAELKARTVKKHDFFEIRRISKFPSSEMSEMFFKHFRIGQIFRILKLFLLCSKMSKYLDRTPTQKYSVSPA